jgi:two-component system chemotaxis response regulator CheB
MPKPGNYETVVIGASAGGLHALSALLARIPENYSLPIVIVQHRSKEEKDLLENVLQQKCKIKIKQADEKEKIMPGMVYIAPANYHLLVEENRTFSLSSDETINYSRPSIDVLFETAAEVFRDRLIGIILTGANRDGANGMKAVHSHKGLTIAQNPGEAEYPEMPLASIRTGAVEHILLLKEIHHFLILTNTKRNT